MYWLTVEVDPEQAKDEALEAEATRLLREVRAFHRCRGIRSPRGMREARYGTVSWGPWDDDAVASLGCADLWDELDALAERAGLTPNEKAVIGMNRVQQYSYRDVAEVLGMTVHRVKKHLDAAERKCRRHGWEAHTSVRTLFWEEIRQKRASVYRAPRRRRRR